MEHEAITIEASLDGLLIIWHTWASAERVGQGYPSEAPGCKLYRTSRQYDYDNGAADSDADASIGAAIDLLVQQMQEPHKSAVNHEAKRLARNHNSQTPAVWLHGRLPICPVERSIVIMEARNQIAKKLQSAGLL